MARKFTLTVERKGKKLKLPRKKEPCSGQIEVKFTGRGFSPA
jgi:hypothetical protein